MLLKWLGTFFTVFLGGAFWLAVAIWLLGQSWPVALAVLIVLIGASWLQVRWQESRKRN